MALMVGLGKLIVGYLGRNSGGVFPFLGFQDMYFTNSDLLEKKKKKFNTLKKNFKTF